MVTPKPETTRPDTSSSVSCAPTESGWHQVLNLEGFSVGDGYADADGCRILLVGEQLSPQAGEILRSIDGGKSFHMLQSFPQATNLSAIAFDDAGTGWVAGEQPDGNALLLKSDDAGDSWREIALPAILGTPVYARAVASSNGNVLLAGEANLKPFLVVSSDGSVHWRNAFAFPGYGAVSEMASAGKTVMAVGTDGIMVSRDHGQTFQPIDLPSDLLLTPLCVTLVDPDTAYVGGYYQSNPKDDGTRVPVLLHTTDGGTHWEKISVPSAYFVSDVKFISKLRGYAVSARDNIATVLITDDGGLTWQLTTPSAKVVSGTLSRLFVASNGTLFIHGQAGLFVKAP